MSTNLSFSSSHMHETCRKTFPHKRVFFLVEYSSKKVVVRVLKYAWAHGERLSHEMGYSGATYCNYGNSCLRPSGGLDYCCCCYMNIGQDRWLTWFNKVNHSRKEKLVNETVIDKTFVSGCLFKFPPRNGPAQLNTTRTLGSFSTLTESSRERLKVAKSNIIATELRGFSPFSLKVILVWFFWTFLSLSFACSPFSLRGRIRFFRLFFCFFRSARQWVLWRICILSCRGEGEK